jgi:hypothetical protein
MQYQLDTSGFSHVSLLDAALGIGTGMLAPMLAEAGLSRLSNPPAWVTQYQPQLAACAGLAVSVPLYFWRGFAPAVIGGMLSIAYGLNDLIQDYLAAGGASVAGIRASRAMGVIQASPQTRVRKQLGARRGLAGVRGGLGRAQAFQGTTF